MAGAGGSVKVVAIIVVVLLAAAAGGGGDKGEAEQVVHHHVVGDDFGWKPSTDLASWLSGRVFKVGDFIWFAYSAAEENIVELQTLEEFLSCDLSNPIRMYSDGLNKVTLEAEGARYFSSANVHNCKNGLKIPVKIQPKVAAPGPIGPSSSNRINITGIYYTFLGVFMVSIFSFVL